MNAPAPRKATERRSIPAAKTSCSTPRPSSWQRPSSNWASAVRPPKDQSRRRSAWPGHQGYHAHAGAACLRVKGTVRMLGLRVCACDCARACTRVRLCVCAQRCLTVAADCCAAQPRDTFLLVLGDGGAADPHLAHFALHAALSLPRRISAVFQWRREGAAQTCGRWQPSGVGAAGLRARRAGGVHPRHALAACTNVTCDCDAHQLLRKGVGVDRRRHPDAIARERHSASQAVDSPRTDFKMRPPPL